MVWTEDQENELLSIVEDYKEIENPGKYLLNI